MHFLSAPSSSLLSLHLTPSIFPPLSSSATVPLRRFAVEPGSVLHSFLKGNFYRGLCSSCTRRCNDWHVDLSYLESEILEFMQSSNKPEVFPTKEELVAAGRLDLVNAIVDQGGWLAYGWDLNGGSGEIRSFEDTTNDTIGDNATPASGVSSSQSDKSVEIEADKSGIDGILNRLEKQRSRFLGVDFREREDSTSSENDEDKEEWDHKTTTDTITAGLENSSRVSSLSPTSSHLRGPLIKDDQHRSQFGTEILRNPLKPEMWRSSVIHRTGFWDKDFEDAENVPSETEKGSTNDPSGRDILNAREFSSELINRETELCSVDRNSNQNDIKSRIQNLESELSSTLHLLRSSSDKITMQMDQNSCSDDLAKFSDACEFQENEIMAAQDRLRSIRAKLSVLEGKMELAIRDAHKVLEEKQKKINNAQKALQILKTTCIVWPNNASEVLLMGSFDGWSSKRKMERSSSGIFSVNLQLYPGRYEMKFIVDGEWKIDPLRPVVTSNGYENNLLIIYDD